MAVFLGISLGCDICQQQFLISPVYIVHLEAVKADLKGLDQPPALHPLKARLLLQGLSPPPYRFYFQVAVG